MFFSRWSGWHTLILHIYTPEEDAFWYTTLTTFSLTLPLFSQYKKQTNKKEKLFRDQKMNIAHTIFGVFGNPFPSISLSLSPSSLFSMRSYWKTIFLCFYRKCHCSVSVPGSFVRSHPPSFLLFLTARDSVLDSFKFLPFLAVLSSWKLG